VTVQEITVGPLKRGDLQQLLVDTVHCEKEEAASLGQLLAEKTAGNPFFAIQFLTSLAEEGLLVFDRDAARWTWDVAQIRARGFTDNIVDLMVGKLIRLPVATQDALKYFACLGTRASVETLSVIQRLSDAELTAVLRDPLDMGLIFRSEVEFVFLHNRVQEAAYALLSPSHRAATHLRIGRHLAAQTATDKVGESIFDIVNQFNRGAAFITSNEERDLVAELNLIAGKRAQAATAFASALTYFTDGDAMLNEDRWVRRYPLAFELALRRGETEFLTGDSDSAETRLAALARCAANLVDRAAVTCLLLDLYMTLGRSDRAVETGLEYLRHLGVVWSAHPTKEEVQQEYERIWRQLGSRPIEELIHLPAMTDPKWRATMDVLTKIMPPALFTDKNLQCLVLGRMANLSLEHGNCDGSCLGYVWLGGVLGPHFGDYRAGFRFGKLSVDLVEQRGLNRFMARVLLGFGSLVIPWTRHVRSGIPVMRRALAAAQERGDLTYAAFVCYDMISQLLASGDALDEVQREAEAALELVLKSRFGLIADSITGQLSLIRTLRGLTPKFGLFDDGVFNEVHFEKHLESDPHLANATCRYWIRKLQARFYSNDSTSAVEAAAKASLLLWALPPSIEAADYYFHAALALSGNFCGAPKGEQAQHLETIVAHHMQLTVWAQNCAENFGDRAALVAAEIARIQGQDLDAMRHYEDAIQLAHEHGFVQNKGIACELAAKFYADRGFTTIAQTYFRCARSCYQRWGALGKVQQLDQRYPRLREEEFHSAVKAGISPIQSLDVETVVKASHALSREIVLGKLIETLMTISIEHGGADRGLLVLLSSDEPRIEAEASTIGDVVRVTLLKNFSTPPAFAKSILLYTLRTRQSVVVDDASVENPFFDDEYVRSRRARSILCLPIIKQGDLIGAIYLENNLTGHAFTHDRLAVLEVLASQAAISIENAKLYADLRQENSERKRSEAALRASEERWRTVFESTTLGIAMIDATFRYTAVNSAFKAMLGYSGEELTQLTPMDIGVEKDGEQMRTRLISLRRKKFKHLDIEKQYRRKDGSLIWMHSYATLISDQIANSSIVAIMVDITESKHAQDALREAQGELARVSRLTTMGQITASIAHEIKQPLAAIALNGSAGLRLLHKTPPDINEAQEALNQIVSEAHKAGRTITGIRAMFRSGEQERTLLDVNELISEVLGLVRGELSSKRIFVRTELLETIPKLLADRVQLQQVLLNLVMNASEAMTSMAESGRTLTIRSQVRGPEEVVVQVEDSGPGIDAKHIDHIFDSFFTTKSNGMGMGLSICRSIIEAHNGRLSVSPGIDRGSVFQIMLPSTAPKRVVDRP